MKARCQCGEENMSRDLFAYIISTMLNLGPQRIELGRVTALSFA